MNTLLETGAVAGVIAAAVYLVAAGYLTAGASPDRHTQATRTSTALIAVGRVFQSTLIVSRNVEMNAKAGTEQYLIRTMAVHKSNGRMYVYVTT